MASFLLWIGAYNVLGSLVLMAMHSERVAELVLRRGTEIVPGPYRHEGFARMWLWWAAGTNLFLGVVMVRALAWPLAVQREVTLLAVGVYALLWLVAVAGLRRPRYGRGIYALHPLWLGQIGWGLWGYWASLR
jgi:hypothetical protein